MMWMALLRTMPSSRILTRIASKKIRVQTVPSGLFCHSDVSLRTASVTAESRP